MVAGLLKTGTDANDCRLLSELVVIEAGDGLAEAF